MLSGESACSCTAIGVAQGCSAAVLKLEHFFDFFFLLIPSLRACCPVVHSCVLVSQCACTAHLLKPLGLSKAWSRDTRSSSHTAEQMSHPMRTRAAAHSSSSSCSVTSPKGGDKKRVRHEHHWSNDVRELVLELVNGTPDEDAAPLLSVADVSSLSSAPSSDVIRQWLHRQKTGTLSDNPRDSHDTRSLLSEQQELTMLGFVLFVLSCHRSVHLATVIDFASLFFNVDIRESWASRYMARHHLTKHKPASLPVLYAVHDVLGVALEWIPAHRGRLADAHAAGWLFSMDQISFWDNALVTHTFSPAGG